MNDFFLGIGGLVTAALLAKSGKRVIVLEQHDQAGGCCHSFSEKGFEFDTGIHYIGEMRNNTAFRFLIDQLSNGQLQWANVSDDFDTVVLIDGNNTSSESLQSIETAISSNSVLPSRWVSLNPFHHFHPSNLLLFDDHANRFLTKVVVKKQLIVYFLLFQLKKEQLKNTFK